MNRIHMTALAGALVVAGVLGAALPGLAQKNAAKGKDSSIGFVDLGRVTDQIKKTPTWQVMTKRFEDERNKYQQEIADLTKIRYLTDVERKEFETLKAKAKPTDAEKARTAELEARSDSLDKEFTTLAGQEKPTADQDARLKALAKMREAAVNALQEETDKRSQSLRDLEGQVLEEMQGKILKFVEQVADSKALAVVIDRQAILYGGLDLTEDVLKKLGTAPK